MAIAPHADEAQEQAGKPERDYQVIGTRPIRPDGTDKVTGRALYGADIRLPGRLYGAVLRSPHAHARILAIDTRRALALPGVRAVVTSADVAEPTSKVEDLGEGSVNLLYQSANILARDKALYHGHAIAAVAATSLHIARQALALIDVTYEVLPPVLDIHQAMQPDAPILLENLRTNEMGRIDEHPSNIASHVKHQRGDLEKGLQEAAVIIEREFRTGTVHQGYIEPHNATALYKVDGQLTIWCSTQGAFGVRDQVANILQIPISKIKVVPMEIGGGFGGKIGVYLEPIAALLSLKSGHQPVKMTMSYNEVLAATGPTSASYIRVKIGANSTGRITAAEAYLAYAAGAFPGAPVWGGAYVIFGPYCIDNLLIDGYDVVVNRPKTEAYRAPGGSNAAFACETVLDEICDSLGMDPLDFRLLNAAKEGDRRVDGVPYDRIGFVETIEAARKHPHYTAPLSGRHLGRGVAAGFWMGYGGKSSASASVNPDGTINLIEGSVDIGGSRASIAMQLAETLGLTIDDIRPVVADTDTVGYTEGTYGSRTTFATGWAAYELGMSLRQQLIERAADLWELDPEQIHFENGVFAANEHQMTFKQLAAELHASGSSITASASVQARKEGPGIGVHIVDVEVDPETGKVQILRYTAVQDAGKAVHPSYVEGQIQGGVAQGIGWALNEEYIYDEQGHLLNASLLDYRLPTCLDLPMIDTVIVEVPNPGHPYGVRGVGEIPIIPPPAAIANAIYQALGVRMNILPMSPTRILEAIWAQDSDPTRPR
jgi:xanthine dehydrogenase molybdenum-binding subunit